MINPREFCREQSYETTLILTYAFDPLFFERLVLPDLIHGGTGKVIVIADRSELEATLPHCAGQALQLGRRYFLCPYVGGTPFHPKMILRISANEGLVWIGSGNITAGGWGGNQELAQSWSIGQEHDDKGEWVSTIIERAVGWVSSEINKAEIRSALQGSWLQTRPASENFITAPVLLGDDDLVLSEQLAERWAGRQFDELYVMTGSTDESGVFLRWAHETFGVKKALIYLNPSRATFHPDRINDLPLETAIIPAPDAQMMHAKFYWFSSKKDVAAIFGSANCSHAAWLPVGGKARNVEIMVPYDHPGREEFKEILEIFENAEVSRPEDILTPKDNTANEQEPEIHFRFVTLEMEPTLARLTAILQPLPPESAKILLKLISGEHAVTIELEQREGAWGGTLPNKEELFSLSLFAKALIVTSEGSFETPTYWVDNIEKLRQSFRARNAETAVGNLGGGGKTSHEQRKIIADIQSAASLILGDAEFFADPFIKRTRRDSNKESDGIETNLVAVVDPKALIKSVNELRRQSPSHRMSEGGQITGLSLGGILGSFFDFKSYETHDDEVMAAHEMEKEEIKTGSGQQSSGTGPIRGESPKPPEIMPEGSRAKLNSVLDDFLAELSNKRFAVQCSAKQLTDASAFPIAICVKGAQGGWVTSSRLGGIASSVCEILFRNRYEKEDPVGLLAFVKNRYVEEESEEIFDQILGDGCLWAVLIAALGATEWPGVVGAIRKAEVFADVFDNDSLLIAANADRLAVIIEGLGIDEADRSILIMSGEVVGALNALREYLLAHWDAIYEDQGNGRRPHNLRDFLWNPDWGWEEIRDGVTYKPGYINLGWAIEYDPEIKRLVDALLENFKN